jgi:hypothetical protein
VSAAIDNRHLRQVALSAFDVRMLGMLSRSGGEQPWYPERNEESKRELVIELMNSLVARDLIVIYAPDGLPMERAITTADHGRFTLRLTDQGRNVATQLAAMQVAPKVEIVGA